MADSVVTQDQDAVVTEVEIAAPPERVFQALVDPKQVMSWWTSDECRIESFAMETKPGGRWSYDTKQGKLKVNGVSKFHCDGEVLEYDPPRLLAYSWSPTGTTTKPSAPSCDGNSRQKREGRT